MNNFVSAPLQDKSFILSGREMGEKHYGAIFTLSVPEWFSCKNRCNGHYTYKVKYIPANDRYPDDSWMVSLLTGPDNWRNYSYIGQLNPETGEFRLTKGSTAGNNSWSVRFIRRVFAALWENGSSLKKLKDNDFELMHIGRCGMCGRRLTTPESIDRGIGPVCMEKLM